MNTEIIKISTIIILGIIIGFIWMHNKKIQKTEDLLKIHKYAFNYRFRKMNELAQQGKLNEFRVDPHNDIDELKWIIEVAPREGRLPNLTRRQLLELLRTEYPKLVDAHYDELMKYRR